MFIIIAFSIIEGILYHQLKELGLIKKEEFKEVASFSNDKGKIRLKNYIFEKIDNNFETKEEFIKSKDILDRAQKNNLLGSDSSIYSELNGMRKFRDKIHIHISDKIEDTDYNSFDPNLYDRQKKIFTRIFKIYFELESFDLKFK